jgi:hypothetical protein
MLVLVSLTGEFVVDANPSGSFGWPGPERAAVARQARFPCSFHELAENLLHHTSFSFTEKRRRGQKPALMLASMSNSKQIRELSR